MMKLGFRYADVVEMTDEDMLGWIKASKPQGTKKKYSVIRKKK
jgi:succinate dehydrogenase flavin-adding protein (antitoxin of CptAB toxin-antitoxin module)